MRPTVGCGFDEFVARVCRTGPDGDPFVPYDYQRRLAVNGLPELLRVPTGTGKTLAAVLPWLYRRRFHPDDDVREATPRRLVVVLPQRALVEQTARSVRAWLVGAGLASEPDRPEEPDDAVGLHVLLGGASSDDRLWKMHPEREAVIVGTQDMVLSRLLMRGYAEQRAAWPVAFGLLHADTQFVFDEVQLMGPALPTSLQLQGLRSRLGTVLPVRSMWMSATVDETALATADYSGPSSVVDLEDEDRAGPLRVRLEATRLIRRGEVGDDPAKYPAELAALAVAQHRPGTRTLVVLNTVERARQVFAAVSALAPAAEVVLLHSRFRPADRARQTDQALAEPDAAGRIVIATQVLEAGIDTTSSVLVTEVAPWSSIVQRAGRCNRDGRAGDATVIWVRPAGRNAAAPYAEENVQAAEETLRALEGMRVTSAELTQRGTDPYRPEYPQLRLRDLRGLFDTAADMSGNDLDVSQWIRDADENTVSLAWRTIPRVLDDWSFPAREELCPVPVASLRAWLRTHAVWCYDNATSQWRPARGADIRPGATYIADAAQGGYLAEQGWCPESKAPVMPVATHDDERSDGAREDRSTTVGRWVTLAEHLDDVEREVAALWGRLPGADLSEQLRQAAVLAGRYHDLGKAHPVFDASLRAIAGDAWPGQGPWAKSGTRQRLRHGRDYFRHELVSALMLLDSGAGVLARADEPELVTYLVAAHHGKVRVTVRSMPDEQTTVLGVGHPDDGPTLPFTLTDGTVIPEIKLDLDRLQVGAHHGPSWTELAARLRDRADLGPFRLGFLEALVRVADWRASRSYEQEPAA